MKYPGLYSADDLIFNEINRTVSTEIHGQYYAARPLPFYGGFFRRLKIAWGVFTGKYDALWWKEQ
jgi:hypothetical protein